MGGKGRRIELAPLNLRHLRTQTLHFLCSRSVAHDGSHLDMVEALFE
jgi:hypothetical protein